MIDVIALNNTKNQTSLLISIMELIRGELIEDIRDLKVAQLDYTPDPKTVETIGTLLMHIAGVEWSWIFEDINKKEMDMEEWKYAFPLRKFVNIDQIKNQKIDFYLNKLHEVRKEVLDYLKTVDENFLHSNVDSEGKTFQISWIIAHLIHHEAMHQGQVGLLKRLYKLK